MSKFDARPTSVLAPLQMEARDVEQWLLAKEPTASGRWNEMGREEYARSFTAARTAGTDIADDLYFGLVDTIARNGSEADFSRLVEPILRDKGWLGGDEGKIANRVRLIYDTNLRLARASGRWSRYQSTKQALPYVRSFTAGDERVRHPPKSPHSDHTAFDGIILPVDHWFVAKYWTPLGFRCRCGWIQMSRSQLARYKGGITGEAELEDRAARIGEPVFASPAMPLQQRMAAMVEATNADRMPGSPRINPDITTQAGFDAWQAVINAGMADDVAEALLKLFG